MPARHVLQRSSETLQLACNYAYASYSRPCSLLRRMSALTAACSHSAAACSSRPRTSSSRSRTAVRVHASFTHREKGFDRPWIQANGQPIMAPRTADMAGDPFGLLLRQRIVFLGGEVEDFGADAIVSQLLLLDNQDAMKDIKLFINSPGRCWEQQEQEEQQQASQPIGSAPARGPGRLEGH